LNLDQEHGCKEWYHTDSHHHDSCGVDKNGHVRIFEGLADIVGVEYVCMSSVCFHVLFASMAACQLATVICCCCAGASLIASVKW
jgi:hypothetical protein